VIETRGTSVDDIFGSAATGQLPSGGQTAPSEPPKNKGVFDEGDDDFEGLEDAKEGSADDDFANISRDDFHHGFDSSRPGSQTKTESTAFGNESSFDFISSTSATSANAPPAASQQKSAADSHDWDAIFSGFDTPTAAADPAAQTSQAPAAAPTSTSPLPSAGGELRPPLTGRALTTEGEHDDPILKHLTGMGYSRTDSLAALEKYDYNLERVRFA
jgi:epidermal growth factor receptor substrate 15